MPLRQIGVYETNEKRVDYRTNVGNLSGGFCQSYFERIDSNLYFEIF